MSKVVRVLRWFEKAPGDGLVGEAVMADAELHVLQALFGVPAGNPMYDCWPVGPAHAATVSGMAGVAVDLCRFDYFVEADAASGGGPA
jgi:hypothetical protein